MNKNIISQEECFAIESYTHFSSILNNIKISTSEIMK